MQIDLLIAAGPQGMRLRARVTDRARAKGNSQGAPGREAMSAARQATSPSLCVHFARPRRAAISQPLGLVLASYSARAVGHDSTLADSVAHAWIYTWPSSVLVSSSPSSHLCPASTTIHHTALYSCQKHH